MNFFKSKLKIRQRVPVITLEISGESTPEDADDFYIPFTTALDSFIRPLVGNSINVIVNIRLDYYNTASTRYITRILYLLQLGFKRKLIVINWYYYHTDEDMKEMGEDLSESMNMKFNIIKVK